MEKARTLTALISTTLSGLVRLANEKGIQKEDIVTVISGQEQYTLLYYV